MAAKAKKFIEECKDTKNNELEIVDKGIHTLEIPGLCRFFFQQNCSRPTRDMINWCLDLVTSFLLILVL